MTSEPKTRLKPAWNGVLSKNDKAYARNIGRELSRRSPAADPDAAKKAALDYMNRVGPERFRLQVAHQRAAQKVGSSATGMAQLVAWQEDDGFLDVAWYFYH